MVAHVFDLTHPHVPVTLPTSLPAPPEVSEQPRAVDEPPFHNLMEEEEEEEVDLWAEAGGDYWARFSCHWGLA